MKTEEEHRGELISLPDQTLETLIDMRFVWLDSVPREKRDEFYDRQRIAEEILAERRGVQVTMGTGPIRNKFGPRF